MDKCLNLLGLARKGGMAELGEEPVGAAARALHAHLIFVASDASDHTWRRAKSFAAGTDQQCISIPYTKDQVGLAVGRTSLAMGAITDPALALSFVKALPEPSRYEEAAAYLEQRVSRLKKLQKEKKAHVRNIHRGRKKKD